VRKIDSLLARYRYHESQRDKELERVRRDWRKAAQRWLKSPDRRVRRAARRGLLALEVRYTPPERWLLRTWMSYRLIANSPELLRTKDLLRTNPDLVPGRYPIMRALSWLKRRLIK
jgi:hypothetical protein